MATAGDTFQRKEKKYLVSRGQLEYIKSALAQHMRLDDYGVTRIDSLYLDTRSHDLIARSLEKPLYKEKLRVRSYGAFSAADVVFVEIKKKFKGIVYKRRVRMSSEGWKAYLDGMSYEDVQRTYPINAESADKELSPGKIQIAREIDAFFMRHPGIEPAMMISCMREAWCPIDPSDDDCVDRITFDEGINYIDLFEPNSVQRKPVTSEDQIVMEIKCAGGYPQWLCDLLSECCAYPRSFSKYGNAYKRVLADRGAVTVQSSPSGKLVVERSRSKARGSLQPARRPVFAAFFKLLNPAKRTA